MPLHGPIVLCAETAVPELSAALAAAGAFPVVVARFAALSSAIETVKPAAIVIDDPDARFDPAVAAALLPKIEVADAPLVPIVARLAPDRAPPLAQVLPVASNAPLERVIARSAYAMRVRNLHATVLRRLRNLDGEGGEIPSLPAGDPLDDATVLVAGRGRSYPALAVAVGERAGLIGALSVQSAARTLAERDVDGLVIGDGFGPRVVEALLTVVAEDARFRDLPVAVLGGVPCARDAELPNFERIAGDAAVLVARFLPLVRLHAFEARLKRMLSSIDAKGMLDPATGLLTCEAFLRDLAGAVDEAREYGTRLCVARFSFPPPWDRRATADAARLTSRLVRSADFACQERDGAILVVFTETDLRAAHVIARRLAGVIKHTASGPDHERMRTAPDITLAAFKTGDSAASLLGRIDATSAVAAE
jgi:hypothetical protein